MLSCASQKPLIDNTALLKAHPQPYKIFGIGDWGPGYCIVTLYDADNQYFSITVPKKEALKIGDIYVP